MAHRNSYWSNSKIAQWVRGTIKPESETASGWSNWEKSAKEHAPIRYWIVETGFDAVQNAIHWPIDKLYNVKYRFVNRYVTRTHTLTAHSLKRGDWHEFETRVLHCLFDELVNFVEIEQAWQNIAWADKEGRKKYNVPWHASGWFRLRTWRCPAAGLDSLNWAANLTYKEDMGVNPGNSDYGKPTTQALNAIEVLTLYQWWKHVRPHRPDPYDASGWTAECDKDRIINGDDAWFTNRKRTPQEQADHDRAFNRLHEIEEEYEREDEEMLIRLIKARKGMWT